MGNVSRDMNCAPGKYLVDANIWIYIHSPIASRQHKDKADLYASVIQKLTSSDDCQIFITPLLISEYINRRIRDYYSTFQHEKGKREYSFKRYREDRDSDYLECIKKVIREVKEDILTICDIACDATDSTLIQNIFERMIQNNIDTNDSFFAELCKQQHIKLITDDRDFVNCDIEVLSDNSRYH